MATWLTCAVGVGISLLPALTSVRQPASPQLSDALMAHLKTDRFDVVSSVRGLPLGVRGGLQTLFGSQALDIARDIADPAAPFQASRAVNNSSLPLRRLIAAECSIDHCLVYYERGGPTRTWHVALFHWTSDVTRFEWGGVAPKQLATIDDVRRAMLAGALTGPARFW